jgi:hypothetical protein
MSRAVASLPASIAAEAVDFILALLLPLIIPTVADPDRARATALRMLNAHSPQDERELQLAAEAVAFSIRTMAVLAEAARPDTLPERRDATQRLGNSLSRSGLAVQRCLGTLLRERRNASRVPPPFAVAPLPADPFAGLPVTAQAAESPAPPPSFVVPRLPAELPPAPADFAASAVAVPTPPLLPAEPAPAADAASQDTTGAAPPAQPPAVAQAEAALRRAQKLLDLMLAHHKGAPPPHTKAAQDIRQQRHVVDAARMALAQARRREAAAPAVSQSGAGVMDGLAGA